MIHMVAGPTQQWFCMQIAMVFQQNREEKRATWCGGWLTSSAGNVDMMLVVAMAAEALRKKRKKMVGG
jgi:hypothetical protein